MGNYMEKMSSDETTDQIMGQMGLSTSQESVETFQFHDTFNDEDTNNGLIFNNIYLPEEIVTMILSHIDPKQILKATLVCKNWCNIIKTESLWGTIYSRQFKKKPKKLPWYVYYCLFTTDYFDKNLLRNGNGQNKYNHWTIILNNGDGFQIENPPIGADRLPLDVPEFNGKTSCFATSYGECNKLQKIILGKSNLIQLILNKFKPHIYLSEWVAGRFDCGCSYELWCKLLGKKELGKPDSLHVVRTGKKIQQWEGRTWSKIELVLKDYPCGVRTIIFQHQGMDTQFWRGHYGAKMAGGVVKILFDSLEPMA